MRIVYVYEFSSLIVGSSALDGKVWVRIDIGGNEFKYVNNYFEISDDSF